MVLLLTTPYKIIPGKSKPFNLNRLSPATPWLTEDRNPLNRRKKIFFSQSTHSASICLTPHLQMKHPVCSTANATLWSIIPAAAPRGDHSHSQVEQCLSDGLESLFMENVEGWWKLKLSAQERQLGGALPSWAHSDHKPRLSPILTQPC